MSEESTTAFRNLVKGLVLLEAVTNDAEVDVRVNLTIDLDSVTMIRLIRLGWGLDGNQVTFQCGDDPCKR